jgi:hypothetical protein
MVSSRIRLLPDGQERISGICVTSAITRSFRVLPLSDRNDQEEIKRAEDVLSK